MLLSSVREVSLSPSDASGAGPLCNTQADLRWHQGLSHVCRAPAVWGDFYISGILPCPRVISPGPRRHSGALWAPTLGTFQVPAPGDIHSMDHLCSSHLLMVQSCFFPQHLSPGHLPKYSKLFLLKSQPILTIWTVNTVWGPRWGNPTGANTYPPTHTGLRNWVHMTD